MNINELVGTLIGSVFGVMASLMALFIGFALTGNLDITDGMTLVDFLTICGALNGTILWLLDDVAVIKLTDEFRVTTSAIVIACFTVQVRGEISLLPMAIAACCGLGPGIGASFGRAISVVQEQPLGRE